MEEKTAEEGGEMSFLDHLEALRWHLIRSVSAVLFFGIIAFVNKKIVFDGIILAPKKVDFLTYRILCKLDAYLGLDGVLCLTDIPFKLINIEMSGQFSTHIFVSFIAGLIIAFPYVIWELWRFIKPALYDTEKQYATGIVFYTSFLFMCGILFGYYLIAPLSVNFLGSYTVSEEVQNAISLGSFINTVAVLTLATGLVFELPILVYFLTKIGILTPTFLKNYRKHSYVGILFLAAIITPPDVASQMLVSVPLVFLYEISIYVSAYVVNSKK